ncbi:MAG TPA: 16S rRNA (guanine(966)-N(2))-methyltransferase RsmD [Candidatus Wallbacteria bacterium]|nr:16S rRNA (guanine(966)-N(2))-methyltransferase RsmD [Candidatus Wallbacteria bacterium]
MRIIAGSMRGKKLAEFETEEIRPITDMAKTALFNILYDKITGADVLDLYAGTGSIGLEAISRGANSAVFVDVSREACSIIRKNIQLTKFDDQCRVFNARCKESIKRLKTRFHFIFMDPPFFDKIDLDVFAAIEDNDILHDGGELIIKHYEKVLPPEGFKTLKLYDTRRYGNSKLSFYLKTSEPKSEEEAK